jgi:hypothetical protein
MRRSSLFVVFGGLLVASGLAGACNSSTTTCTAALSQTTGCTVTTPTIPGVNVTETYSGSVGLNGLNSYNFTVSYAGSSTTTAALTTLTGGPPGATVGFGLGTWNGSSCSTTTGIVNQAAVQGTVLTGQTNAAGSLCVVIQDAFGILTTPVSYTISVVHQ